MVLHGSRKYPYFPYGRLLEILKGKEDFKALNALKENVKQNWNFQRGGRFKQKTSHGGSIDISGTTHWKAD